MNSNNILFLLFNKILFNIYIYFFIYIIFIFFYRSRNLRKIINKLENKLKYIFPLPLPPFPLLKKNISDTFIKKEI